MSRSTVTTILTRVQQTDSVNVALCAYRGVAAQVEQKVVWTGRLQDQAQSVEVTGLNLWFVGSNTVSVHLHRHLNLKTTSSSSSSCHSEMKTSSAVNTPANTLN